MTSTPPLLPAHSFLLPYDLEGPEVCVIGSQSVAVKLLFSFFGDLPSTPPFSFCVADSTASQRPGASIVPSPGCNQRKPLQSKAILFWRQVLVIPSKVRISEILNLNYFSSGIYAPK